MERGGHNGEMSPQRRQGEVHAAAEVLTLDGRGGEEASRELQGCRQAQRGFERRLRTWM